MGFEDLYRHACMHVNRAVEIDCADGMRHKGIVHSVDMERVYLQPIEGVAQHRQDDRFFPGAFIGGLTGALTGVLLGNIVSFRPYPYPYPYPYYY